MTDRIILAEETSSAIFAEWEARARGINTTEEAKLFMDSLINDYEHDYGTIVHAMFYAMRGAFFAVNNSGQGHITGFQAQCLAWLLLRNYMPIRKDEPISLIMWEKLLWPHNQDEVQIPRKIFTHLQKEAAKLLETTCLPSDQASHLETIIQGRAPFGLTINEEE